MKYRIIIIIMLITLNILNSQTANEIKEMQELYNQYKKGQVPESLQSLYADSTENSFSRDSQESDLIFTKQSRDSLEKQPMYFGYDFFSQRDSIPFWPNTSTPENYILGPGDNVEISLWGRAQLNQSYTINRDGNIYDKSIGIIHLNGKTLKEARIFLKNKYAQKISSLLGQDPTSFINVTLGELKSINVHFIGHVKLPGVHLINPLSTVITGLIQAGGIDTTGSLRKIQIYRSRKLYKEIDFYSYLLDGNSSDNILLQNDDIIKVPTRLSEIMIEGEIYRSSIYETLPSESLGDVVEFAGGVKPNASNNVTLKRIVPLNKRATYTEPIEYKTKTINNLNKVINQNGDVITINTIPLVINEVIISGQIKEPGSYVLTDSMTIIDLLIRAGGIEDKNYLKSTFLDKIEIIRVNEKKNINTVIELSFQDLLTTNIFDKYILQKDDHIVVHENINYKIDNNIQISGEVAIPGIYSLEEITTSLDQIILEAGGFTEKALINGMQIYRGQKKLVWDDMSSILVKGDSIYVPSRQWVVEVQGDVYNPGLIKFKSGRSARSYIRSVGGFKDTAKRSKIAIMYPNGNIKTEKLFPKKVTEGCTIIVYEKPERDSIELGIILRDTLTFVSTAVLTLVYLQSLR